MPTRRRFLYTSLVAAALPLGWSAPLRAATMAAPKLRVVIDSACGDAAGLLAQCHGAGAAIAHDPSACLSTVIDDLARGTLDAVVGLTRDSHQFVFTQAAAAHGYRLNFHAVHRYHDGMIEHRLSGDTGLVSALGHALRIAAADWPRAIVAMLPVIAGSSGLQSAASEQVGVPPTCVRPAYLVTWSLGRVAA